jgi:hypothetical protein
MSRLSRLLIAAVFCVALAVPALAAAKPAHRSFGQTFPHASRLCVRTTNGHAPKALAGSVPAVLSACATLHTSFTDAQNAYTTTVGPLQAQAVAAVGALHKTCVAARQNHTPGVCKTARAATKTTIQGLRAQVNAAGVTYHASVNAARKAFWATIHGLKGGSTIAADPTVPPAPTTTMPSDSQIASS